MSTTTSPEPWERKPKESDVAFEAFVTYRDMGADRSYAKVGQKLSKSTTIINRWGGVYNWVERVESWDNEQDRLVRESFIKGITAMRKKHIDIAAQMLLKALRGLRSLKEEDMTPRDIATMVDISAKLERLSRGEVTERTEGKNEISGKVEITKDPYEELSVEELRALARIADENKT